MRMSKPLAIDSVLPLVKKPGRYIGGELNSVCADPATADCSMVLVFPDLYEIGMSHQGLQILYHIINRHDGYVADRCYAPDVDLERELRNKSLPLFSIEQRRPLNDFDIIGITLPYELCFTNILTILDLGGIPLRAEQRGEDDPIVIAGGSCALNPEPVADFFDAIVLGDGEEVVLEVANSVRAGKAENLSRKKILQNLSSIDGVYVPCFFQPQYDGPQLTAITALLEGYETVSRRVLPELPSVDVLARPLVPLVKPVHDRLGVEIARGCTRGCRFCQAGMIYRPVRERPVDDILKMAEQGIESSGFDELALLSLSSGDFSCLPDLLVKLMDRFVHEYVSVSLPSMRVGTLTPEVINQIKRVRKTGFTVAPEAGTDRLREVINKGITEQDLMKSCQDAFAAGWNLIKFYFMIGLPTETLADVDGIVDLAVRAKQEAQGKRAQINVSAATFVPKPHTPFQWAEQLSLEESQERINRLKKKLPRKGFKLKWHDPYQSFLEGVFSRGDRRLSRLLESAWQAGCRLDGWSEHFNLTRWQQAAENVDIDLNWYLRARKMDEVLPWDHLSCGVDKSYLEKEYEKSVRQVYTPDCRNHSCQKCGLCDFKTLKPVVNPTKSCQSSSTTGEIPVRRVKSQQTVFSYRVHYSRLGDSRFLGHLEMLQLIFRVLHRAGLPVLFSQGYNPSPRVSFSQALPVGVESHVEYFDMDLSSPLNKLDEIVSRLNAQLPEFITVTGVDPVMKKAQCSHVIYYEMCFPDTVNLQEVAENLEAFDQCEEYIVQRIRKRKKRQLDIKPLIEKIKLHESILKVHVIHPQNAAGTNPREILEQVAGLSSDEALLVRVTKLSSQECASGS